MSNRLTSLKDDHEQAEDQAKDRLTLLFSNEAWFLRPSRQNHEEVLSLLKQYPRLLAVRFQVIYPNDRMIRATPLILLVESQATLDIVQAAYTLNPAVLSKDFDLIYILRRACQYRASAAVVEYLGLKFPKALADSHYKQIALSYALREPPPGRGRSSLETIQILLKLCPKSVHFVNNVHGQGDNALGLALMNGYDLEVIRLILEVMEQQACNITSCSIPARWNFTMDTHGAKSIDLVLSRSLGTANSLSFFDCRPTQWTNDGFVDLMQGLTKRKTCISAIQLNLPNETIGLSGESVIRNCLQDLCGGASALQELELCFENTPPVFIEAALLGLQLEEGSHPKLGNLVLHGAAGLDFGALCTFLASDSAPARVQINSCQIHGRTQATTIPQSNKIQRLEVKDSFFNCKGIYSLLDFLGHLPKLEELHLIAPSDFVEDSVPAHLELPVEALVDLMRKNTLHTLEIVAYTLDADVFYDSFLENSSLRRYRYTNKKGYASNSLKRIFQRHSQLLASAMEYSNASLVDPYIGDIINQPGGDYFVGRVAIQATVTAKIDHYATLNSFGRRKARDPTETVATIVELLCAVVDPYSYFPCLDPSRRHNLQYGLLRESLSIWSAPHFSDRL